MNKEFLGVIILESLADESIMQETTVLKESNIKAPAGDPYPVWSRRLVSVRADGIEDFARRLAGVMKEDFYNHFVDEKTLVVVFKGQHFVLDKYDKSQWGEMVQYGETVRVGERWTLNIPVEGDRLL